MFKCGFFKFFSNSKVFNLKVWSQDMGFIKAGFTGGFIGIVISIADIFYSSKILERFTSVGLYLAAQFGKACINTETTECSLADKFTTILATIVGNTIAYFLLFALISLLVSLIVMLLTPSKKTEVQSQPVQPQIVQVIPVVQPQPVQIQPVQTTKATQEKRPKKRAKVRKK